MDFQEIDTEFLPWVSSHYLHPITSHQEYEVRYLLIVDDQGDTYQISLLPADPLAVAFGLHGTVSGQTFRREREKYSGKIDCSVPTLAATLDSAFDQICSWITERGHTRTPVK